MSKYPRIKSLDLNDPVLPMPEFEYLSSLKWVFTEKLEGEHVNVEIGEYITQCYGKRGGGFVSDNARNAVSEFLKIEFAKDVLQGKSAFFCGMFARKKFFVFDIRIQGAWVSHHDFEKIAERMQIATVPKVGYGTVQEALDLARKGVKSAVWDRWAAGVIIKPVFEFRVGTGQRVVLSIKA